MTPAAPCSGGRGTLLLLGYRRSNRKMEAGSAFWTARYTHTGSSARAYKQENIVLCIFCTRFIFPPAAKCFISLPTPPEGGGREFS